MGDLCPRWSLMSHARVEKETKVNAIPGGIHALYVPIVS
jgi:hypothetical protein